MAEATPLLRSTSEEERSKQRDVVSSPWKVLLVFTFFALVVGVSIGLPLSQTTKGPPEEALPETDKYLIEAHTFLQDTPLIDGHNDLPHRIRIAFKNQLKMFDLRKDMRPQAAPVNIQTDIPRIKKGRLGAQFWSVYSGCDCQYKDAIQKALDAIDVIKRLTIQYSEEFQLATSATDVIEIHRKRKLACLMGVEGGHLIANSASTLRMYYDLGVRYMTLTWNCNTPWSDYNRPSADTRTPAHGGLTEWGKELVLEMNRIGMMVDLSHVSAETMRDALDVSRAPIIFSHSNVRALCPHPRNVPDDVLKRVKENGGIVMINFSNDFINCTAENALSGGRKYATMEQLIEHMDYIKEQIGSEYIGIGSDFDGNTYFPDDLNDVSMYPNLIVALLKKGWTEQEVKQVIGRNILRVMNQVEQVRDDMQSTGSKTFETPINPDVIPFKGCIS